MVSYHNNSLSEALFDLFGLNTQVDQFTQCISCKILVINLSLRCAASDHWKSVVNRRNFFLDFARSNQFDPLIASNWFSVIETVKLTQV